MFRAVLLQRRVNVKCINLSNRSVPNCSDVTILHLVSGLCPSSVLWTQHVSETELFLILRGKITSAGWVGPKIWKQQLFIYNTSVPINLKFLTWEVDNQFRKSCVILRILDFGKIQTSRRILTEVRISLTICKHFNRTTAFLGAFRIAKLFTQIFWKPAWKQNSVKPRNFCYFLGIEGH